MSKLSRNLRKKLSAGLAVIMAVSLAIPAGVSFSSQTVKAEGLTSETKDGDAFYDFRDGSIGQTKITLGGCQYSATGTITATSADGSYSETKDAKTKDCYHNSS